MRTWFGYKLEMDCKPTGTAQYGQLKNSSRSGMKHLCILYAAYGYAESEATESEHNERSDKLQL